MKDLRPGSTPDKARGARSRRRAGSAVVASYIHEISTRHGNGSRRRVESPAAGYGKPLAIDTVGCA
jgi:hypothetical protein